MLIPPLPSSTFHPFSYTCPNNPFPPHNNQCCQVLIFETLIQRNRIGNGLASNGFHIIGVLTSPIQPKLTTLTSEPSSRMSTHYISKLAFDNYKYVSYICLYYPLPHILSAFFYAHKIFAVVWQRGWSLTSALIVCLYRKEFFDCFYVCRCLLTSYVKQSLRAGLGCGFSLKTQTWSQSSSLMKNQNVTPLYLYLFIYLMILLLKPAY